MARKPDIDWEKDWAKKALKERSRFGFDDLARTCMESKEQVQNRWRETKEERKKKNKDFCELVGERISAKLEELEKKGWLVGSKLRAVGYQTDSLMKPWKKGLENRPARSRARKIGEQFVVALWVRNRAEGTDRNDHDIPVFLSARPSWAQWLLMIGRREEAINHLVKKGLRLSALAEARMARKIGAQPSAELRAFEESLQIDAGLKSAKGKDASKLRV